jgi:uridine phosphorylase
MFICRNIILQGVLSVSDNNVEPGRKGLSDAETGGIITEGFVAPNMGEYVLLPGNPGRISLMAGQWDDGSAKEYDLNRGYRAATGTFKGTRIAAMSTGMGGPNLELPLTSLSSAGVRTFIRVGTTGAIQEGINIGDIIINDCSVRLDGTSGQYVRKEYPSAASYECVLALIQACENLGVTYHVGVGCTTASFYAGQSRTGFGGYKLQKADADYEDMRSANVLNYDMEGSALFTLARLFGLRAGMCASVIVQRVTGEVYEDGGEARACLVGAEAIRILTGWDKKKEILGKKHICADVLK